MCAKNARVLELYMWPHLCELMASGLESSIVICDCDSRPLLPNIHGTQLMGGRLCLPHGDMGCFKCSGHICGFFVSLSFLTIFLPLVASSCSPALQPSAPLFSISSQRFGRGPALWLLASPWPLRSLGSPFLCLWLPCAVACGSCSFFPLPAIQI